MSTLPSCSIVTPEDEQVEREAPQSDERQSIHKEIYGAEDEIEERTPWWRKPVLATAGSHARIPG
jgi:hypothetical protein